MDIPDLIKILKTVPPCHLRLFDYARLVLGEDGEPDSEKVVFYAQEVAEAVSEAEAYANATRSVVEWLGKLARSHS